MFESSRSTLQYPETIIPLHPISLIQQFLQCLKSCRCQEIWEGPHDNMVLKKFYLESWWRWHCNRNKAQIRLSGWTRLMQTTKKHLKKQKTKQKLWTTARTNYKYNNHKKQWYVALLLSEAKSLFIELSSVRDSSWCLLWLVETIQAECAQLTNGVDGIHVCKHNA